MRSKRNLGFALALSLLPAAPALAQESGIAVQEDRDEMRLPTYMKAPMGARAMVKNDRGQTLGVFREHVVDRESGHVTHVAIGGADLEGDAHLVPYDRFEWNQEKRVLVLPLTAEELRTMPVYDPADLRAVGTMEASSPTKPERDSEGRRGGDQGAGEKGTREAGYDRAKNAISRHIPASRLTQAKIHAGEQIFATTSDLILEPKTGAIAFVLAQAETAKDDPFIVPWGALTIERSEKKADAKQEDQGEKSVRFRIEVGEKELRGAPKLANGELDSIRDYESLKRIFAFYGLEAPNPSSDATRPSKG